MNDDQLLDAAAAHAIAEYQAKMHGVQATPWLDKLRQVMAWLKLNGVDVWSIIGKVPDILKILTSGKSLLVMVAELIALFGLPAGTAGPVFV